MGIATQKRANTSVHALDLVEARLRGRASFAVSSEIVSRFGMRRAEKVSNAAVKGKIKLAICGGSISRSTWVTFPTNPSPVLRTPFHEPCSAAVPAASCGSVPLPARTPGGTPGELAGGTHCVHGDDARFWNHGSLPMNRTQRFGEGQRRETSIFVLLKSLGDLIRGNRNSGRNLRVAGWLGQLRGHGRDVFRLGTFVLVHD